MLVHIFDDTPHHYMPMRDFLVQQCRVSHEQQIWVRKPPGDNLVKQASIDSFVYYTGPADLLHLMKSLPKNVKFLFHGLLDVHIWKKLAYSPLTKRSSCVIWGAELYRHGKDNRNIKERIAQYIHALLIKRFKNVIALNNGDADLVCQYLKRSKVKVLPYPLIGMKLSNKASNTEAESSKVKILIGNSAAESNEHLSILESLVHLSKKNVEVIAPLNYAGNEKYIKTVINYGYKVFGDKFTPITQMMNKASYDQLLSSIHVTVFSHRRQQGLYVVYAMLLMGKPIFLREETSSFKALMEQGFEINRTESLLGMPFEILSQIAFSKISKNSSLMNTTFTEDALSPQWSNFLNGLFVS